MATNDNVIKFISADNEEFLFSVLEQTTLNGVNYLLVTMDPDEEEAECYVLKEVSEKDAKEAVYDMVEDDKTLNALAGIFSELLEDTDVITED
ncbi:MAG: DUF1292 domain-containing protein [Lachnospiraceae bacterium]|nr:DUF1292 domain-containing protein [Lachnospiraceae bacterium]